MFSLINKNESLLNSVYTGRFLVYKKLSEFSLALPGIENNSLINKYFSSHHSFIKSKKINKILVSKKKNFNKNIELYNYIDGLKYLHSIEDQSFKKFDILSYLNTWIKKSGSKTQLWEKEIIEKIKVEMSNTKLVLCHNDLHIGNLKSLNNSPIIIDYDFMGLNHYLFDVIGIISEQKTNLMERRKIIEMYFDNKTIPKNEDLILWEDFHNIFWKYWALYMHKMTLNSDYLSLYTIRRNNIKKREYKKFNYH